MEEREKEGGRGRDEEAVPAFRRRRRSATALDHSETPSAGASTFLRASSSLFNSGALRAVQEWHFCSTSKTQSVFISVFRAPLNRFAHRNCTPQKRDEGCAVPEERRNGSEHWLSGRFRKSRSQGPGTHASSSAFAFQISNTTLRYYK